MKCQHIGDSGQCQNEAARDIRIVTGKQGWRLFLCNDHWREEMDMLKWYIEWVRGQDKVPEVKKG